MRLVYLFEFVSVTDRKCKRRKKLKWKAYCQFPVVVLAMKHTITICGFSK